MKKTILVVINPQSSRSNPSQLHELLKQLSTEFSVEFQTVTVNNDTIEHDLTQAIQQGITTFWVAGGDGTVSSVAKHIDPDNHTIGIIPVGTGNMVAQLLGIPLNVETAVRSLITSNTISEIDGFWVNERIGFLQVSIGLSAEAVASINKQHKSLLGTFSYIWGGITNLSRARSHKFAISIDGTTHERKGVELIIASAGAIGHPKLTFLPDTTHHDGKLDVFLVPHKRLKNILRLLLGVLRPNDRIWQYYSLGSGQEVAVTSAATLAVQMDGDIIGSTPIRVSMHSQRFRFISP